MAMPKPKAVSMVGICGFCHESTEIRASRSDVKKMLKTLKGQNSGAVIVPCKCVSCGRDLKLTVPKNQIKSAWEGLKGDSILTADITSEKLLKDAVNFRRARRRLKRRLR